MRKNIIYSSFDNERQWIIDFLYEHKEWDPVFVMGLERMRGWVKENYKHAVFQDSMQLRNAQFDYAIIGKPAVPVDAKIIGALSKYELSCFNVLEDTTGWNFSFAERRRYYYDILKYWNTVIHHLKPDICVYFKWPHVIVDYVLYLLCKHYYSIPTIFVNPAPLFDNFYHTVCTSLEDMSSPYKDVYNSGQKCDLKLEIREYLNSVTSREGKTPEHISSHYRKSKKYDNFQYREFAKLILAILRGRGFRKTHMAFKKNRHPFESPKSKMNRFEYFWFKDHLRRHNHKLRKIYGTFTEKPDYSRKYLYFALPYQPEATTCPNAGVYEDVLLVLDILSVSIPPDWVIYYKEHPSIFMGNQKGSLRRDRHFYEKVASYHNVVIVPVETDTFKLIDNSQAVASIAGTVCWEAVIRGKPSLFFGNVWYQDCKSLFRINTLQDCRDAIEKIVNGYKPDKQDIERYVSAVEQFSVKGMIHREFHENIKKCPDPKYEMERIAEALYEIYERHYAQ